MVMEKTSGKIRLGDAASFINGFAFKPDHWGDVGRPIIRIQNLNNTEAEFNYYDGPIPEKYIVRDGDILISWSASLGAYEWNRGEALLNQHIFKVVFDKAPINKHYLRYAVLSKLSDMEKDAHGATMRHIVKKDFDNTLIPYPSIDEQVDIVSELDLLTGIIEKKQQQLKDLDSLSRSLFYEMFGDPIKNDKGWPVVLLESIASCRIGLTYKPENVCEDGTIVLRSSNIQVNEISLDDIVRVNCGIREQQFVQRGDILMCSRNGSFKLVGKVATIGDLPEKMSYGAFMTVIRSQYNPYLFEFFKLPAFRTQLGLAKTATINQITVKMLANTKIALPPKELQDSYATKICKIYEQKAAIHRSIDDCQKLLDSRMAYYFN